MGVEDDYQIERASKFGICHSVFDEIKREFYHLSKLLSNKYLMGKGMQNIRKI